MKRIVAICLLLACACAKPSHERRIGHHAGHRIGGGQKPVARVAMKKPVAPRTEVPKDRNLQVVLNAVHWLIGTLG